MAEQMFPRPASLEKLSSPSSSVSHSSYWARRSTWVAFQERRMTGCSMYWTWPMASFAWSSLGTALCSCRRQLPGSWQYADTEFCRLWFAAVKSGWREWEMRKMHTVLCDVFQYCPRATWPFVAGPSTQSQQLRSRLWPGNMSSDDVTQRTSHLAIVRIMCAAARP